MLTTLLLGAALCAADVAAPVTVAEFPTELRTPVGVHMLTGTGVRTRTLFKVKVYTFGLYVDREGARIALAQWRGKSAGDLTADPSVYDALLNGGLAMTLRLEMSRDVTAGQMAEAFGDALAPRLVEAAQRNMPGGADALSQFRALFTTPLTRGTELLFTWSRDDKLLVAIGGRQVGVIDNRALAWAVFDVYLGPHPISPKGKRSVIARLPELLST